MSAPISLDLLSEDEQHEHNHLLENVARVEAGPAQWRYQQAMWVGLVWAPGVLLALYFLVAPQSLDLPFAPLTGTAAMAVFFVMLLWLLGGVPLVIMVNKARRGWLREHQPTAQQAVDDFLVRIGYEDRVARSAQTSSDDYTAGLSVRAAQHAWYGDHSEFNWRDRQTAGRWGMSADEYAQWQNSNDPD